MVHNHINFNQTHQQLKPRCQPELIIYSMYKFDAKLLSNNNSIGVTIWICLLKRSTLILKQLHQFLDYPANSRKKHFNQRYIKQYAAK